MRRHDNAAAQQGCEQTDNQQFGFQCRTPAMDSSDAGGAQYIRP
jgi:hypothetical protein